MFHRKLSASLVAITLLGSCGTSPNTVEPALQPFGHVHGLGTNPADDQLYVATHNGVYVVEDGAPLSVGANRQDTMGFEVIGPDQFVASGHPAELDQPNPLGLISSSDAGQNWTGLSLVGEADLHAIDVAGDGSLVAFDAGREQLIRSSDQGRTWTLIATQSGVIDIVALPISPFALLVTTADGQTLNVAADGVSSAAPAPPGLTYLDATAEGTVVGVDANGDVWRTNADDWEKLGTLEGAASAISTAVETWYVAVGDDILGSSDMGLTWKPILQ